MNQAPGSSQPAPSYQAPDDEDRAARRMFIFEAGWRVGVKTGSQREFCYMMAPGQDYYHRLLDGEIFLVRDDEGCASPARRAAASSPSSPSGSAMGSCRFPPTSRPCPSSWIGATPNDRADDPCDHR